MKIEFFKNQKQEDTQCKQYYTRRQDEYTFLTLSVYINTHTQYIRLIIIVLDNANICHKNTLFRI
jgi:hypothetical protein